MKYLFILICFLLLSACGTSPRYYGYLQEKEKGVYFFYETRNDSLLAGMPVEFSGIDTTGIYKKSERDKYETYNSMHLKVRAQKTNAIKMYQGLPYKTIVINRVKKGKYKKYSLAGYSSRNQFRMKQIIVDSVFTGFYVNEFEGQLFRFANGNHIDAYKGWITFDSKEMKDSVAVRINKNKAFPSTFLKIKAELRYGVPHGYGHYSCGDYSLDVKNVIAQDSTRNLNDELIKEFEKGYIHNGFALQSPDDYESNKEVVYSAALGDSLFELKVKKTSTAMIAYDYVCRGKTQEYMKFSGIMHKDLETFVDFSMDGLGYGFARYYTRQIIENEPRNVEMIGEKENESDAMPIYILFNISSGDGGYYNVPVLELKSK